MNGSSDIISSRGFISLVATTTRPFSLVYKILYGRHVMVSEIDVNVDGVDGEDWWLRFPFNVFFWLISLLLLIC